MIHINPGPLHHFTGNFCYFFSPPNWHGVCYVTVHKSDTRDKNQGGGYRLHNNPLTFSTDIRSGSFFRTITGPYNAMFHYFGMMKREGN